MTRRLPNVLASAALLSVAATSPMLAQADLVSRGAALTRRVEDAPNGTVRLTFALRPGVCGSGNTIRTSAPGRTSWRDDDRRRADVEWDDACAPGPGRLALDVRSGRVEAVRFYVGGRWRATSGSSAGGSAVTDLGDVSSAQAAGLLLGIAERGSGKVARDAVFPSTLADSVTVWPSLLRLARSEQAARDTRSRAVFWLGNAAGDAATAGLTALVDDPEREIRDQAVFALSRRGEDAVPALIRVARTNRDPATRRSALFWLGQSKDPRALALFEELLTGK